MRSIVLGPFYSSYCVCIDVLKTWYGAVLAWVTAQVCRPLLVLHDILVLVRVKHGVSTFRASLAYSVHQSRDVQYVHHAMLMFHATFL